MTVYLLYKFHILYFLKVKEPFEVVVLKFQATAPIAGLSETSSDSEDSGTKVVENRDVIDVSYTEKVFMTGVLDELKICFNSNRLV